MIEPFGFQSEAAEAINERFRRYISDPLFVGPASRQRMVPFFQALAAITAAGKTVILADAVAGMVAFLPVAPVVLWLSKGKVVVEQTFANLLPGGKYHHLLEPSSVRSLAEFSSEEVAHANEPQVFFATVGTFNQRDKEEGSRLIYRSDIDTAEQSTWDSIRDRLAADNRRRPLIVVYDEAHNLTDQQTSLLMELEPTAFLVASATMRLPGLLGREVDYLRDAGWSDTDLVTSIDASQVVECGLVKANLFLGGYEAPMEETLSSMLSDFREISAEAVAEGLDGKPKAIYICKTNIVEGDAFRADDPKQPFGERQAPPILIWRYLTETASIPAYEIAVYCSLKFHKDYPAPPEFVHFKGGTNDYSDFVSGGFRHVIFNLGLQEGWDDPLVYSAYIDKSMESNVRVEQTIGRLLRQPGVRHYRSPRLNSAHFYIRVDRKGVFNALLDSVSNQLHAEAPPVRVVVTPPGKAKPVEVPPIKERAIYETAYETSLAVDPVNQIISQMNDYTTDDGTNTRSKGGRVMVQRQVGSASDPDLVWEEFEHTNEVSARWVFQREIRRRFAGALGVVSTESSKFDALVGFGSPAYTHIANIAERVVAAYIDSVYLKQRRLDLFQVGPVLVRVDDAQPFNHAVHPSYSGLNPLERQFAIALDETGLDWCRNPPRSGYGIPLITVGPTSTFYPDFLVWKVNDVFAIDTTGPHILAEKVGRKLLNIAPVEGGGRLYVRFVSEGSYEGPLSRVSPEGYTVWTQKQDGSLRATYSSELADAVGQSLSRWE